MSTETENGLTDLLELHMEQDADNRQQKVDAEELAKYRALVELLAGLVAPQLDADVARAVSAELAYVQDARANDDRANDDRERDQNAEINEAVEAAVTEAMGRLTDWLSPEDVLAVLNREAYGKIANTLVDNGHLAVESDTVYSEVDIEITPEVTLVASD
jgi:hypothetical protein